MLSNSNTVTELSKLNIKIVSYLLENQITVHNLSEQKIEQK